MILGIDASNIRAGGGLTHLIELLKQAQPDQSGFTKVVLWGGSNALSQIEDRSWLDKQHAPMLDGSLPQRVFWQKVRLDCVVSQAKCDLLFIPGGSYTGSFSPTATMSQNLLPFDWIEVRRYGLSLRLLRFTLLKKIQAKTFRCADGVIFLTNFARDLISKQVSLENRQTRVIPHGISQDFFSSPKVQKPIEAYSTEVPFRFLYVSRIDAYKHHWAVAKAVAMLRQKGFPVQLDLIGSAYYRPALSQLEDVLMEFDPNREFICYHGSVPYRSLPQFYQKADASIFASSCENLPIILLENMASGLPISCAKRGPMPEVLKDAGVYFDPEKPAEISAVLESLLLDPQMRANLAEKSFHLSKTFTWRACADSTFDFLEHIFKTSRP